MQAEQGKKALKDQTTTLKNYLYTEAMLYGGWEYAQRKEILTHIHECLNSSPTIDKESLIEALTNLMNGLNTL